MVRNLCMLIVIFAFISCENNSWQNAHEKNSIEEYRKFLEENPESEFVKIVEFKIDSLLEQKDSLDWATALNKNTTEAFQKYIDEHAEGEFIHFAKKKHKKAYDKEIIAKMEKMTSAKEIYYFSQTNDIGNTILTAKDLINQALHNEFEENYKPVIDFFYLTAQKRDYQSIKPFIDNSLILITAYSGAVMDTTIISDAKSYSKIGFGDYLINLKKVYENGGVEFMIYIYEKEETDTVFVEYYLEYLQNGIIFTFYEEYCETRLTFSTQNNQLYLKELYYYEN